MSHANASLTPTGRLRLARCIVDDGWPLRRAAKPKESRVEQPDKSGPVAPRALASPSATATTNSTRASRSVDRGLEDIR